MELAHFFVGVYDALVKVGTKLFPLVILAVMGCVNEAPAALTPTNGSPVSSVVIATSTIPLASPKPRPTLPMATVVISIPTARAKPTSTVLIESRPTARAMPTPVPTVATASVMSTPTIVPMETPTLTPTPSPGPALTPAPEPVTLIKSVTVAPDKNLKISGAFCRINHVPAVDKFLVTFGGTSPVSQGYGYKWYTSELEFTGKWGIFQDRGTDTASVMVGDAYYFLTGYAGPPIEGAEHIWVLKKFDPVSWALLGETQIVRDPQKEFGNDQMLAYVNGMLDVSSLYDPDGQGSLDQKKTDPRQGASTHHRLFTTDLEFLEYRVLSDTPHINGSSMVYVDGFYYMVTSSAYFGDLIVMKYDGEWDYLGSKVLARGGNWSMGSAYDGGGRFYVAYLDDPPRNLTNVRLGIFDTDWNPISDIAVTEYSEQSVTQTGRPWVTLHNGHVYVSYDVSTVSMVDPKSRKDNRDWRCVINMYGIKEFG